MKNVFLKKVASLSKDMDIVVFALVAAAILLYIGWELVRVSASM